ncbi:hypothetical protein [Kitasatospora cathayae]|uniref:PBS lyase n=1 Tax=Kitasatospora cathayae TaxID=3004092 RepID=A0ABY7Q125_9ACTN|nr:hypothetical protein [Kitasatospora sp. HUAS 3-15]WBP86137.1 hypothetical protein O1G21_09985 [Kitasatospora sp. HUAS 3-15]
MPGEHRPTFAALMARLAIGDDIASAGPARGHLVAWGRYVPEAVRALVPLVTDLAERDRWKGAAQVLIGVALADAPHPLGGCAPGSVLADALTALIGVVRAGEPALPGHDQPALRRIAALVGSMWCQNGDAAAFRATQRAVAALLLAEPVLVPEATRRLVTALDPDAPDLGERLAELSGLVAEDGLAPGLFAVALATAGAPLGWPAAWQELLHALRRDPRPDVRDAALAVYTEPA